MIAKAGDERILNSGLLWEHLGPDLFACEPIPRGLHRIQPVEARGESRNRYMWSLCSLSLAHHHPMRLGPSTRIQWQCRWYGYRSDGAVRRMENGHFVRWGAFHRSQQSGAIPMLEAQFPVECDKNMPTVERFGAPWEYYGLNWLE
jgi:hypothetical protein